MRYLIVKHYIKGTYFTNNITREDLVGLKNGDCELIVDTENNTYFEVDTNSWKEIQTIS